MSDEVLKRTPLHELHLALGAKMVGFAGYDMPVYYPLGILNEHKWTRENAGLFDVSHMGQWTIAGPDFESTARAMEQLIPADVLGLGLGQQRYTQFLNEAGGCLDDLMVTREPSGALYVVVNAGCKVGDERHVRAHLPKGIALTRHDELALLALQGPKAEAVLVALGVPVAELAFMHCKTAKIKGFGIQISRSGYTGEDGFEISVHEKDAAELWRLLLSDERVKPIGLGARDSLRLEAGLCLYGHELTENISPIEAGLQWSIAKRRRVEGGFLGSTRVQRELKDGPPRKRVGIKPEGRAPAREGAEIQDSSGRKIGVVTSGGFGPSVNGPVAMGYVETASSALGTKVQLIVRGAALTAVVTALPFIPNRFKR